MSKNELTEQQIKECVDRLKKVEQTHKDILAMVEQTLMALYNNSGNWEQVRRNLLNADAKQTFVIRELKDIAKDYNLLSAQVMISYLDMTEMFKTIHDADDRLVELIDKENENRYNERKEQRAV